MTDRREMLSKFDRTIEPMNDVIELRKMQIYGAIIGKAYYTGDIDLRSAVEVAK